MEALETKAKELLHEMNLSQYKNFNKLRVSNGHEIYRMNIEDGVVSKAEGTIDTEYDKFNRPYKKNNVKYELGYLYVNALNLKNAHKKFNNIMYYVYKRVALNKLQQDNQHLSSLRAGLNNTEINTKEI